MPLLNDHLTVWEIGFRWADQDPSAWSPRIPLPVRDNFRILMEAILEGHLFCFTISLEKRGDDQESPYLSYIRDDIDAVYHCIQGLRYPRKLLKWAGIERWAMEDWCRRQGIPLPEFWFPPGWNLAYRWPNPVEDSAAEPAPTTEATDAASPQAPTATTDSAPPTTPPADHQPPARPSAVTADEADSRRINDRRIRRRIACQEVAIRLWRTHPDLSVKAIANSPEVQKLAGGEDSDFDVLLRWLGEVDPRAPSQRRGPKRRK